MRFLLLAAMVAVATASLHAGLQKAIKAASQGPSFVVHANAKAMRNSDFFDVMNNPANGRSLQTPSSCVDIPVYVASAAMNCPALQTVVTAMDGDDDSWMAYMNSNTAMSVCPEECFKTTLDTVRTVVNAGANDFACTAVKPIVAALDVLCAKEGSTYCVDKIAALAADQAMLAGFDDPTALTAAQLDQFCHPCVPRLVEFALTAVGADASALGINGDMLADMMAMICRKENGQYCLGQLAEVMEQDFQEFDLVKYESTVCTDCGRAMLNLMGDLADKYPAMFEAEIKAHAEMVKVGCSKYEGKSCIQHFSEEGADALETEISAKCATVGTTAICPAGCKEAIQALRDEMGCCVGAYFEVTLAAQGADTDALFAFLNSECNDGAPIKRTCIAMNTAQNVSTTLANVEYEKLGTAEKDSLVASFKEDLETNFGISADNIASVTITQNSDGSVVVDFSLVGDSEESSKALVSSFDQAGSAIALTKTAEVIPASALKDASAGVTVEDKTVAPTGGARATGVAVLATIAATAAALHSAMN